MQVKKTAGKYPNKNEAERLLYRQLGTGGAKATLAYAQAAVAYYSARTGLGDLLTRELEKDGFGNRLELVKLFAAIGSDLKLLSG